MGYRGQVKGNVQEAAFQQSGDNLLEFDAPRT
jgi:hypothetical protein